MLPRPARCRKGVASEFPPCRRSRSPGPFHLASRYPESVQTGLLFPTQPDLTPEIPPTWCEGSEVFHTTEKCTRLQAIQRNKRVTGKPGVAMRQCFNCEDIIRAKRLG
jgi:hypothetical protein